MPFPIRDPGEVVEAIERSLTAKTRLLLIDHVTSPTGLIFPIAAIIELAKRKDIRVMIDGAHAPGMIPVDLDDLQPDYYTANHHKWLCGPKTSGFLYVRRELQSEVRPTVISHGANSPGYGDTSFLAEFNWMGTFDPTPILSMTRALEFLRSLFPSGLSQLMRENQKLAVAGRRCLLEALELESPAPESMLGSLASIPIPVERLAATQPANTTNPLHAFQQQLFGEFRIEVPVFPLNPTTACLRISAQAYNSIEQYRHLAEVLNKLIIR
jgi:isopenicillin-N epimerase